MILTWVDWTVIGAYFLFTLLIGSTTASGPAPAPASFSSPAGTCPGGWRARPWWRPTFAADTPLAVTGMTVRNGIAGNWLWWCYLLSGMMTVFFFARLWRRAEVVTDIELVELRYSGRPAALLRGFRAIYWAC